MAFRTQKISQMTPKGADLEATDLIEVSTIESGSYVTRSITGQELIDAIPAPTGFVPDTRTLTINGVAQDLSADRSWTISTGLTVGTTPISSGTIGRVLFQGTGNVLQQSSSLFWDSTNNRLGIGTSTPDTNKFLDILYNVATVGGAGVGIRNSNSTGYTELVFDNNTTPTGFGAFVFGYGGTGSGLPDTAYFFQRRNAPLIFGTNGSTRMQIHGNGNVGINTTTDAGFRLDVNGTARVQGNLTAIGAVNSVIQHTALTNYSGLGGFQLNVADGTERGTFKLNPTTGEVRIGANGSGYFPTFYSQGVEAMRIFASTRNIGINTTTDAGFRLDVNGTARVKGTGTTSATTALTVQNSSNSNLLQMRDDGVMLVRSNDAIRTGVTNSVYYLDLGRIVVRNGDALGGSQMQIGSNLVPVDSAVLDLNSTTRGFLPPRMTTTQKNAIASPATGLQVYDTTLNQMSYYNGTTWTNI